MTNEERQSDFHVDIEGTIYDWPRRSITPAEIRKLGSLPEGPVLEIDKDNNQRELPEDTEIELKHGIAFSKKVKFARG